MTAGDQPRLGPLAATVQAPGRVEHEDVRGQHERAHHVVDGVGRGRDHDGHVPPRHVGGGDAADDPVQHAVGEQQVQHDERAEAGAQRQQPAHGSHAGVEGHHPHGRRRPGQLRREEHVLHHLEVRLRARRRVHDDDRQGAGRDGERLGGEGDADGAARAAPQAHEAVGEGGVDADPRRHGHEDDWDVHVRLYSTSRSLCPQSLQEYAAPVADPTSTYRTQVWQRCSDDDARAGADRVAIRRQTMPFVQIRTGLSAVFREALFRS